MRVSHRGGRDRHRVLLLIGTLTIVPWILSSASLQHLPAGLAGLLVFTYPAWTTVIEVVLGREPFNTAKCVAAVTGLLGIALLLGPPYHVVDGVGVALGLGAGFTLAIHVVLVAGRMQGVHPLYCSALVMTGGAIVSLPLALFDLGAGRATTGLGWLLMAAMGGLSATGIGLFLPAVSRIGASSAAIASNLQPVVTVVLAAVVLGERLGLIQAVGAALVIFSVGALPLLRHRRPTSDGAAAAEPPAAAAAAGALVPEVPPQEAPIARLDS
jgi:drug/metabolite transporter (DMT)-like permease